MLQRQPITCTQFPVADRSSMAVMFDALLGRQSGVRHDEGIDGNGAIGPGDHRIEIEFRDHVAETGNKHREAGQCLAQGGAVTGRPAPHAVEQASRPQPVDEGQSRFGIKGRNGQQAVVDDFGEDTAGRHQNQRTEGLVVKRDRTSSRPRGAPWRQECAGTQTRGHLLARHRGELPASIPMSHTVTSLL